MKIAVVIPCRNERSQILDCIEAINSCELPHKASLKIFVVDGMSDDGTRELVTEAMHQQDNLFLIDNLKQLTPFAFNLGIKAYPDADFVQIVGARHILSKNYIDECLKRLDENPEVWCVGGKIVNEYENKTGEIVASAMGTAVGMGLGNFRTLTKSGFTDTVTSPMYPYAVFNKIGYFDEDLIRNQDDDFNFRVLEAGGKIFFEHDISLKYFVRGSFSGLWRQFFQYGYWKVFVNKKHKAVTTIRQLVPPAYVVYIIALPLLTYLHPIFMLGIGLHCLLITYSSIKLAAEKKLPIFKLILTFYILHLSYGFGYLKGIFHFLILKKMPSSKQKRLSR